MSTSPDPSAVSTAHSFNKILNQYKTASKARSAADMDEATKKIRRLILVDGIPSTVVCLQMLHLQTRFWTSQDRTLRSVQGFGRSYFVCEKSLRRHSLNMLPVVLAKCEKRSGTTPSGSSVPLEHVGDPFHTFYRTLATDRGFKERVSEDMLVRLLDAFVWRNHGKPRVSLCVAFRSTLIGPQTDKRMINSVLLTCRA